MIDQMIKEGTLAIDTDEPYFIITKEAFYQILDPSRSISAFQASMKKQSMFSRIMFQMLRKHPSLCRIFLDYPTLEEYLSDQQFLSFLLLVRHEYNALQSSSPCPDSQPLRFSIIDSPTLFATEDPPILYHGHQIDYEWYLKSM